MSKVITVEYEGTEYTMAFTRASVRATERLGFDAREVESKPVTMISLLVRGAFKEYHPNMLPATAEAIYQACTDKEGLLAALLEMYVDVANTLMAEPEVKSKKASWKLTE